MIHLKKFLKNLWLCTLKNKISLSLNNLSQIKATPTIYPNYIVMYNIQYIQNMFKENRLTVSFSGLYTRLDLTHSQLFCENLTYQVKGLKVYLSGRVLALQTWKGRCGP